MYKNAAAWHKVGHDGALSSCRTPVPDLIGDDPAIHAAAEIMARESGISHMMGSFQHRKAIKSRPRRPRSGETFFMLPSSAIRNRSEELLIVTFVSNRYLFGCAYSDVQPDYYYGMPPDSGVLIYPLVKTKNIVPQAIIPGDIDLLVIPYEDDQLILDRILAIEVKAVRVRFEHQSRSPNEFGFSQASGLLALGFPYVAVAHLIVSDVSPRDHWKEVMKGRVGPHDEFEIIGPEMVDPMPRSLIDRSFGRMTSASTQPLIGIISAYVTAIPLDESLEHITLIPQGRTAQLNPQTKLATLEAVASFYEENYKYFLDNPRYAPPN